MSLLLVAALAAATIGMEPAASTAPDAAEKEPPFRAIMRAVFANDRLWLLSDDGKLVTIGATDELPTQVDLPEPAKDLCLRQGAPLVVAAKPKAGEWTVRQYDAGKWRWVATVPVEDEGLVALNCSGDRVALLTNDRLIELQDGSTREVPLSQRLWRGRVTSTAFAVDGKLLVGVNAGEWGGGLKRIDRTSGKVETIERNSTGGLCDGPLNTQCDPVHAVAVEPWKPNCLVAAVGLVHFTPHGRLVEVCGKSVERLYFKPFADGEGSNKLGLDGEPYSTVAFFGLARGSDGLIAVGIDGLYRLRGTGEPEFVPLPKFRNVGDYWVSFDLPDAVLVMTNINQRASISGAVPMLVMRP